MSEPLNILCYYTHFGRPYGPALKRMTESVKRVMPHARTVLMTSTPFESLCSLFDATVHIKVEPNLKTLCFEKSRAIHAWQSRSEHNTIFVDPDVEFLRPLEFDADVTLTWRATKLDQPVNAGLILARPGHMEFWDRYIKTVAALPPEVYGWWCDQLGFSIVLGSEREAGNVYTIHGAQVRLVDQRMACSPPEKAWENAWSHHYKGVRKGAWAEPLFVARPRADGKSSPASVSSMASDQARSLA